ncbi:MAG: glycosyltransferase [Alistipes sp.]|nr:glycosyltransferase [Alistipes sp.]
MRPCVSVCVPIYRVEKDLRRCLDSLVSQTLSNIEIILIDDGSPDGSGRICDEYAERDARIKVVHKENGGLSSARRVGLELSTGEYYIVCDSDDWVEPTMYEELYRKAKEEDADIVLCDYISEYSDGRSIPSEPYTFTTQEQYIEDLILRKANATGCCKLYRLNTIRRLGIDYAEGINLGEDALFIFKLLLWPQRIVTLNRALYHYQRNIGSESYTNNISLRGVDNAGYVHRWKGENYTDERYARAHQHSLVNYAFVALRCNEISKEQYREILDDLSLRRLIRHKALTTKSALIVATKYFGLKFGRICLKLMYRHFYK